MLRARIAPDEDYWQLAESKRSASHSLSTHRPQRRCLFWATTFPLLNQPRVHEVSICHDKPAADEAGNASEDADGEQVHQSGAEDDVGAQLE